MLNSDELNILRTIKLAPTFILVLLLITNIFIFNNSNNHFERELDRIKEDSILEKKRLIKIEVLQAYKLIQNEKSLSINKIKAELQEQVHQAHAIADSIYRGNQDKKESAIKQLISDALRNIRFNRGRGYFFIYQTDGLSVMHPIMPHIENTNMWDFQDTKNNYVIRNLSHIATDKGEGFLSWWWKKPADTKTEYEKVGYSKHFAPFNWFIGTGDYVLDYEDQFKEEILARIHRIKYGKNGYIFIVDKSGTYLSHIKTDYIGKNRINLVDDNGVMITQEIINAAQRGEDYISYIGTINPSTGLPAPKTSFIKGFADWQWAIGSGIYMEDIEQNVLLKKNKLKSQRLSNLKQTLIVGTVISSLLFFISLVFSRNIKRRFQRYKFNVTEKTNQLNELNLTLENKVIERTKALADSNTDLELALLSLKETQQQLIASEKIASMVDLVAGVAHELNTPLGIMVTSISQIESELEKLFIKIKSQKLSRKDLQRAEELCALSAELLNSNLAKSIQLIDDFKSLSTSSQPEPAEAFSLNKLMESLNDSYQPKLEKHNTQLTIKFDGEINVKSYKETIIEVLRQLIDNSLMHAFTGIESPKIAIRCATMGEFISIDYWDNGSGLEESAKVFDLFYTTKRNTSCTGLGMAIVYNKVTQKLQGSIESTPPKKQGVAFNIKIPT